MGEGISIWGGGTGLEKGLEQPPEKDICQCVKAMLPTLGHTLCVDMATGRRSANNSRTTSGLRFAISPRREELSEHYQEKKQRSNPRLETERQYDQRASDEAS